MVPVKKGFLISCSLLLPFVVVGARAQDYQIDGGQQQQAPPTKTKQKSGKNTKAKPSNAPAAESGIGWGNSIEVGRLARAAQDALKHGNPSAAATYAQRAVQAASATRPALPGARSNP